MQDLGDLQWFLGIRVIRDRPGSKLWLCQDSYQHQQAADQLIRYLFATRHLAIQFNGKSPVSKEAAGPN
ncbi:hypothetical protein B0J13DRAFT_575355 [Dactylonectria estremocensis]|uniref:Reverse transcriptase Ty1/copia-type domain-containing protein n=1 Tax=Dactylonectria estremocensis TaxID=1079267 RepID=A0A9P9D5G4_9HYPO|nr:hypothetical protein B0J13DRAFT_575355 [Dactylonectria estremocensis]